MLFCALFLSTPFGPSTIEEFLSVHPIWINEEIEWHSERSGDSCTYADKSSILSFNTNHDFVIVCFTLIKSIGADSIHFGGDGGSLYVGKWKSINGAIIVEYRLIDKTVKYIGEQIPGNTALDTISVFQSGDGKKMRFQNEDYIICQKLVNEKKTWLLHVKPS